MRFSKQLIIAAPLVLMTGAAYSHHGPYGTYALDDRIDFTGIVVGIEWVNPHAFVLVRAELDGVESVYRIELPGIRQLRNKGWAGDELKVGEPVRVVNAAPAVAEGSKLVCCARLYDREGREYFTNPRNSDRSDTPA